MEWEAPLVSCETRATTFVVVRFATCLPIPLTDASDPATRMKRHPKATTMKGDTTPKNGGNYDDEEREKDTEKREKENGEGETTKKSRGQTEEGRDTKKSRGQTEEGRDDKEGGRDEQKEEGRDEREEDRQREEEEGRDDKEEG